MAVGISLAAAARLLGIPTAAQGGEVPKEQPVLVGERGPEVIYPATASVVVPGPHLAPMEGFLQDRIQDPPALGHFVKPAAWDDWLASRPESSNVQDLRTPEQKIKDNELWRVTWDPTFENPWETHFSHERPRVQFPPAEEKPKPTKTSDTGKPTPNLPDWLKDQESQWLKSDKAKKYRER